MCDESGSADNSDVTIMLSQTINYIENGKLWGKNSKVSNEL